MVAHRAEKAIPWPVKAAQSAALQRSAMPIKDTMKQLLAHCLNAHGHVPGTTPAAVPHRQVWDLSRPLVPTPGSGTRGSPGRRCGGREAHARASKPTLFAVAAGLTARPAPHVPAQAIVQAAAPPADAGPHPASQADTPAAQPASGPARPDLRRGRSAVRRRTPAVLSGLLAAIHLPTVRSCAPVAAGTTPGTRGRRYHTYA